jgi:hypothetical protein
MSLSVILHSVTESPQKGGKAVRKVAGKISTVWHMVSRRSMRTVWSERGDGAQLYEEVQVLEGWRSSSWSAPLRLAPGGPNDRN